tara:strand:+ start:27021 stop:28751 length:1731 start_codon:yes stop_codon:yes gene_type:complete
MMRELLLSIRPLLSSIMENMNVQEEDWSELLASSTDSSFADVAMPCHSLSKILKKSPVQIADQIFENIGDDLSGLCTTSSVNGFLNFSADPKWLSMYMQKLHTDERLGVSMDEERTIVVDYSSPNVAKHMHVGHLRSTVIGDSLVRMLTYKGHLVVRENHIGDWGTPFGMLIEHLLDVGENNSVNEIDLATFYKDAREKFESDLDFSYRSRKRVVKMQSNDPETISYWQMLVDKSLLHFNEVYQMMGVLLTNNDLAGESKYESSLSEVVNRLAEVDLLKESQGAQVVFPEGWCNREGEPLPLIIRKADGGYNYATSDLACIIDRVENVGATDFLYVVGAEQAQHFAMVFQVARKAGFMDDKISATHVPFGLVMGTDGKKLASRTGGAVHLKDLLIEAVERASSIIIEKNPSLSEIERNEVARMLGIGAIKYADLSTDRNNNYTFDWEKMLSFDGNTAPYLQYAHARICSIFSKANIDRYLIRESTISISNQHEVLLAKAILSFPESLDKAIDTNSPHKLATQLHSLAQAFATFYEFCPVISSEPDIFDSRIALCDLTARTLKQGLELLGIEAPTKM